MDENIYKFVPLTETAPEYEPIKFSFKRIQVNAGIVFSPVKS